MLKRQFNIHKSFLITTTQLGCFMQQVSFNQYRKEIETFFLCTTFTQINRFPSTNIEQRFKEFLLHLICLAKLYRKTWKIPINSVMLNEYKLYYQRQSRFLVCSTNQSSPNKFKAVAIGFFLDPLNKFTFVCINNPKRIPFLIWYETNLRIQTKREFLTTQGTRITCNTLIIYYKDICYLIRIESNFFFT